MKKYIQIKIKIGTILVGRARGQSIYSIQRAAAEVYIRCYNILNYKYIVYTRKRAEGEIYDIYERARGRGARGEGHTTFTYDEPTKTKSPVFSRFCFFILPVIKMRSKGR